MKNIKRTLAVLSIYFLLALSVVVNATEIINDVTGNQSAVDAACVAPIPFFNGEDCSYNETDPTGFAPGPGVWAGPTVAAWYYLPGQSPGVDSPPSAGDPADELSLTGTITIDDKDSVDCADDTITGEVILGAGTRAFGGGQGAFGEESWGDGDIKFPWAETGVDTGAANVGGGCDYVIASAGYPPRIEEAAAPNRLYPVNASSFVGFYVAPSPVGIAFVTEGNAGVQIEVTVGAGWSCVQNGVGAACNEGAGLNDGGSHFKGTREILETVLLSISTDGAGNVINGEVFITNESKIFNVAPNPYNSWDGSVITLVGTCQSGCTGSDIDVDPTSVDYGDLVIGDLDQANITITNDGNADLNIGLLGDTDGLAPPFSFGLDGCSIQLIPPSGSCNVTVDFQPNFTGAFNDSFNVPSDDPDTPNVTVNLSGNGLAVPSVGGTATGLSVTSVRCKTKGKPIDIQINGASDSWDCELAGLNVQPGDKVEMRVIGIVE